MAVIDATVFAFIAASHAATCHVGATMPLHTYVVQPTSAWSRIIAANE